MAASPKGGKKKKGHSNNVGIMGIFVSKKKEF